MRTYRLLLPLCALSCHSGPNSQAQPPEQPSAAAPTTTAGDAPTYGAHRAPVSVRISGPAKVQTGQDVALVAHVAQRVGAATPVTLELKLPPGVRLVEGLPTELMPSGTGSFERHFVVHIDDMPSADLQLIASTRSRDFGARAQSSYRFGRPEPKLPEPARADQDTVIGGRNLGRGIDLSKTKP